MGEKRNVGKVISSDFALASQDGSDLHIKAAREMLKTVGKFPI